MPKLISIFPAHRHISITILLIGLIFAPCQASPQNATASPEAAEPAAASATPTPPAAFSPAPCLIVKHKGTVGRRLIFTALIGVPLAPGTKYDLVDTVNYNAAKVAFKGKELQELQAKGVHVTVLEKKYTAQDLESARKACTEQQTSN